MALALPQIKRVDFIHEKSAFPYAFEIDFFVTYSQKYYLMILQCYSTVTDDGSQALQL